MFSADDVRYAATVDASISEYAGEIWNDIRKMYKNEKPYGIPVSQITNVMFVVVTSLVLSSLIYDLWPSL